MKFILLISAFLLCVNSLLAYTLQPSEDCTQLVQISEEKKEENEEKADDDSFLSFDEKQKHYPGWIFCTIASENTWPLRGDEGSLPGYLLSLYLPPDHG